MASFLRDREKSRVKAFKSHGAGDDDSRRRREDTAVQIRKRDKGDQLAKRRQVRP